MIDDLSKITSLIATQVMGWELLRIGYFGTEEETPRQKELEDWIEEHHIDSVGEYWIKEDTHFWLRKENWTPTEDIHQAWMVLEKFPYRQAKGVTLCDAMNGWVCEISDGGTFHQASADTAPLAICLAALKAIREKEAISGS